MWQGTLLNIHTAPQSHAPMVAYDHIKLIEAIGLDEDRLATGKAVYDFLCHRSGLICTIVRGGMISVGDTVQPE